jgi:hypothetical protein
MYGQVSVFVDKSQELNQKRFTVAHVCIWNSWQAHIIV